MTVYESIAQALSARDMTSAELSTITGSNVFHIRNAIASGRRNGTKPAIYIREYIRPNRSSRLAVYSLTKPEVASKKKQISPRYVPPFRELTPEDHDLWRGRDLAMLAR